MNKLVAKMMFLVAMLVFATDVMAQVPQGFNFQAVARDANGELITNTALGVRVSVIQGAEEGTAVYTEVQNPTTTGVGSFQIVIGEGTSEDEFSAVEWSADNYYVKLEIDPAGGEEYEELGTTRLLSVPYALVAQDVVNGGSSGGGDTNYGSIEFSNADGDTLAHVYVENLGDTASRGMVYTSDDLGRSSTIYPGFMELSSADGSISTTLSPYNLYFRNNTIETIAPPAWYGTLRGDGFTQLLDFNDTGVYEGGILTGFWPGQPTIMMEDGSETPLVILEGQKHEDRNIGVLTLRGTDGSEFSITSDGMDSGRANGQTIDSLFFATNPEAEFQRNSFYFPGYQRFEDQDGNFAVHNRSVLQYGNYGDEGVYNWYNKGGMQVAAADYPNGERASGLNPGSFYMDIYKNGNFYAPFTMGIGNDEEGGRPFFSMSSLTRMENELGDLFSINVVQDPNGNDPNGESSELFMWGDTSPNIQMGGQQWENTDHAYLQLFGSIPDGNGWYLNNSFWGVGSDGTDEWGSLSLLKNNIAGQTSEETILLDGQNGNINISGSLSQSSDERLKKDIQTLDSALEKTGQLRGVSYTWKTDAQDESPQIGVIAQEVEKVYPEFVHTDEAGMKSVNYAQMTAVLIEAVKELNTQVQNLQNENATLQAKADKQTELENRLAQIEKLLGQNSSASTSPNGVSTKK